jgi:hypothetical protein
MLMICTLLGVLQDGHILREGSTPQGGALLPPTLLPREESRGYSILPLKGQAPTGEGVTKSPGRGGRGFGWVCGANYLLMNLRPFWMRIPLVSLATR